jgi:uncharacterized protein (DUF433 family)
MTIFDSYIDGIKQPLSIDWSDIRALRNRYLIQTDIFLISDYPLTNEQLSEILSFRDILRNIPSDNNTVEEAADNFPDLPSFVIEGSEE